MKTVILNTKEIRQNLEGFLLRLKRGQRVQVMYRSRPLVSLIAEQPNDEFTASDAGTPSAAKRSVKLISSLPKRPVKLDPNKSFKQLYNETQKI